MTPAEKVLQLKQDFDEVYASGYEKGLSEGGGGGSDDGVLASLIERTITEIEIPKGITKIGKGAFLGCQISGAVTVPDGVTSIEERGIAECLNITELRLPDSLQYIGTGGISLLTSLKRLVLPPKITQLTSTMAGYGGFTEFIAKGNITRVVNAALRDCKACLSYDFTNCTKVPMLDNTNAFMNINTEAKIFVPASLYDEWIVATNWSQYADYIVAYSDVVFPDSASEGLAFTAVDGGYEVAGIGECTDTEIVIPSEYEGSSVVSIGRMAFSNCSSITSVVIPDSVTSVGEDAFYGCSNIESINIPDSVTSIGASAFYGLSSKAYTEYENAYYLGNDGNAYVYLQSVKDTTATSLTIRNNTKFIGSWACSYTQLTTITIPKSVIGISGDAFYGCSSLASVTICGTITDMGTPFADCPNLTDIYVPWSEGEVVGAPWGAYNATIHYNSEV